MRNKPLKQAFERTPQQQAFIEREFQIHLKLHKLLPTSSNRIPDWRWQLVQVMAEHPWLKRYHRQDPGVQMAQKLRKYLQYLNTIGTRRPRKKPLPEGVMDAYALYCRHPFSQAELKARLLAEEPLPDIARKISSTQEAIKWYEQLFFNIADRLQASSYIEHFVVIRSRMNRNHPMFLPAFMMNMGYNMGAYVVDLLVKVWDRILEPITSNDLIPTDDPTESSLRKIKLLIEARSTLFDFTTPQPLLDIRGLTELDIRERQTYELTRQIHVIQSLSTPLADSDLIYDAIPAEHDFYLEEPYSASSEQTEATKIAV
jgi:hypothetical protein